MRLLLPFLGGAAMAAATASAQDPGPDWGRCRAESADTVLAGCTALIGSGRLANSEYAEALARRASAYRSQRDYSRAIADYEEGLRRDPRAIWARDGLAAAYRAMGNRQRAVAEYDAALRLAEVELGNAGPQSADYAPRLARVGEILLYRGLSYEEMYDDQRALRDYRESLRRVPQNPDTGNTLCMLLAMRGESLDEARAACDASLRLRPDHAPTLDSRGLVALKQARFQDAWNDYDAATRLQPEGSNWVYGRGVAALRLGRTEEGRADIARAEALDDGIADYFAELGIQP